MCKKDERVSVEVLYAMKALFDKEFPGQHVAVHDLRVVGHRKGADAIFRDVTRRFPNQPVIIIPPKGTPVQRLPSLFRPRAR